MKDKKQRKLRAKQEPYLFTFVLDGFIGGENVEFYNGLNSLRFVFDYRGMKSVKVIFNDVKGFFLCSVQDLTPKAHSFDQMVLK